MARTNVVKAARKPQGNCQVCGKPIDIGDSYKWVKPRYRGKIVACPNCTIPLYMTSSSKMVAIWQEMENIDHTDPENLRSLASTIREVGEEYQTSADNQKEYFPDSEVAQENEEKAGNLSTWADEIESAADSIDTAMQEAESAVDNCPE